MILTGAFIFTTVWTWKAASGWESRLLTISCAILFLLLSRLIPSVLSAGTDLVVSLGAGVACIALMIRLGSWFRSEAMKAVIEGEEEPVARGR